MTEKPRPPAPDTIAGFIKAQRWFYGWKQQTLAAKAGVSLSTVERVERCEPVKPESLRKLAVALNQPPGAFTDARLPLSDEEAARVLAESFSWMEGRVPVAVAPFQTQAQLRDLVHSDLLTFDTDLGDEIADDLAELREWLDLTGFVRAEDGTFLTKRERGFPLRRLYGDVQECVRSIEKRHRAVCLVCI